MLGRVFIVLIVAVTYSLSLLIPGASVFRLGVWCFTGFAALAPLVFAALYWKRATKAGAYACIIAAAVAGVVLFAMAYGETRLRGEDEFMVWGMMPVTINIAASTAALIIVSLLTQPPSAETVAKFFPAGRKAAAPVPTG